MIEELRNIETILIEIKIRGEEHLNNVTKDVIGGAVIKSLKIPETYKKTLGKLIDFALKINGMISLEEKISSLPEALQKLLSPG